MRVTEATEREARKRTAEDESRERRAADRLNPPLSGAALVHECERAVATVLARTGRKVSEDERDSLIQTVACDALTGHRERYPDGEPLRRSHVGRTYLSALARGHLKQSRGWRDTLDGYRTRGEREHGLVPLIAGSVESAASADEQSGESEPRGWLSQALARERGASTARRLPAIAPEHLRTLADSLSETLADECGCTDESERRKVRAAVESACGVPLIRQSERPGSPAIATLKRWSASGAALVRERLSARECAVLVRIAAERESEDASLRRALRTSMDEGTERLARAASDATEAVLCGEYAVARRASNTARVESASPLPLSRFRTVRPGARTDAYGGPLPLSGWHAYYGR